MKFLARFCCVALSIAVPASVFADTPVEDGEILAKRGKGVVTQEQFSARANKIPERMRFGTLRDRTRMSDILMTMLLQMQLAAEAREAGFDKDPMAVSRMKLAAEVELAEAWLQHYVAQQSDADYEALARQYYQLHSGEMLSEPAIDVSHILVSTEERGDEKALALAHSIYEELIQDPASFDELVKQHSEDPSAASNKGRFKGVKKGEMVGAFEKTAFAMQAGEISEPVRTNFGYHIIRLDAHIEPRQRTFDEVKDQLMEREHARHEQRVQNDYLSNLSAVELEITEAALREMARRQFGEDVLAPEAEVEKTE
jgi:parvulin-like peptidyl-prolyl isomerase